MYIASRALPQPSLPPRTPSGKAHEEINKRIQDLNARWSLGLKPRDGIWTPGRAQGTGTIAEQCVEKIKYLHYSAATQLDSLLSREFPLLAQQTPLEGRLPLLFGLLTQLFPDSLPPKVRNQESRAKNRIFREGDPELERPSGTTEFNVSPALIERTNSLFHRGTSTFSEDPEVQDLDSRGYVVNRSIDSSGRIHVSAYLHEPANEEENRKAGPSTRLRPKGQDSEKTSINQILSRTRNFQNRQSAIDGAEEGKGVHSLARDQDDTRYDEQFLAAFAAEDRRLGLSDQTFGSQKLLNYRDPITPPGSDTEGDASDVFFSPPGSPAAEAAERKKAQRSPSMSSSATKYTSKDRCKRRSDGEDLSPPKRRVSQSPTSSSAYYSLDPGLNPPALIETFRSSGSRLDSAMTSFAASTPGPSQNHARQIESANTSFASDVVGQGPSEKAMSDPWGSSIPSLPPDLDNLITNQGPDKTIPFEHPAPALDGAPSVGKLSTHTMDSLSTETRMEMIDIAAKSELRATGRLRTSAEASSPFQEPAVNSSATTETMSTAEREALYDFADMVVEQSFTRSRAEKSHYKASLGNSSVNSASKDRTIRPGSPSPRRQHNLRPASRATATTTIIEMQDAEIDSPLRRHDSEDFRLSSLPGQDLFFDEGEEADAMSVMPFKTRFECSRVALASGLPICAFATADVIGITSYDNLWSHFKHIAHEHRVVLPKRSSAKAWEDKPGRCEYINLKAKLAFNDKANSRQSLFKLKIDPIEWDKPCRFQYAYGGDRFLYLFLPNLELKDDPSYLKQAHKPNLIRRLQEWLIGEKNFLGRKWRVMHVEPVKEKTQAKRKERLLSYRIILFATHGYDILPKLDPWPYKTRCTEPSSSPETTVEEIIRWFMPLEKTAHQPYCKAFARLDLGFSKTWRTIVFKPSQVIRVPDIMSDGTLEATEFDDQDGPYDWSGYKGPIKPTAMNDGCSQISVGACLEIWETLGLTGPIPSAFQARINGAKGVWIRSAATDTTSRHHLDVWIEISASQEKFKAHEEDTDDNFDPTRWTFEVVSTTHSLQPNTLNVAFIPILEDRNVSYDDLQGFIKGIMDAERHELVSSVENPVRLRAWVQKHMVGDGDRAKNKDEILVSDKLKGGLPFARVDRVMHLLEAGFTPDELPLLGSFVEKVVKQHFSLAVASFKIKLPKSTMVIGIADPTGTLRPGEISMFFSTPIIDEFSGECFPFLDKKEVLVARHPSLRNSDVQKVRAVYRPELAHLLDVVVFASKGSVPLAGKLQGGDYDGDTFWVCWEPALTKDFKNAPAPLPHQLPKPEKLGIKVDSRKLGELLVEPDSVSRFLSESFKFRFQPDLLGRCTNLHKRLVYKDNSLSSRGVVALANLHDYLIDSAKNGYIFSDKDFERYVKDHTDLDKASLKERGYEEAIKVGFEDDQLWRKIRAPRNLDRILDMLYFSLIEPEIRAAINDVTRLCTPKGDINLDESLAGPHQFELRESDADIRQELTALMEAFPRIYDTWNRKMFPIAKGLVEEERSQGGRERWSAAIETCYPMYEAIMPQNVNHSIIKRWTKRRHLGPTEWDLIKASALYTKFPYQRFPSKALFIWTMAGKHLMYIKGVDDPDTRPIRPNMLDAMKPTKLKVAPKENDRPLTGPHSTSPTLGEKILEDFTQPHDDECSSDEEDFASLTDFLDRG